MKPFLKWAGSKTSIVERIRQVLPAGNRLIEPFAGSAALFMNTDFPSYLLADSNAHLIALYQLLQKEGDAFIACCAALFTPGNNAPGAYYALRAEFNATRDRRRKAALFLYLNRHCYNGLCRYNASGGFNVPMGRYAKPYFPAEEMRVFHERSQKAVFKAADFRAVMGEAVPGDVVYCDPPYVPLSRTASFTAYQSGGFGEEEQRELALLAGELSARGVPVIISNHDTDFTRMAYAKAKEMHYLDVQRFISSKGARRGKAKEMLAVFSGKKYRKAS